MKNRTRISAIAGTALALVIAATAAVAAAGPRDRGHDQQDHGFRGRGGPGLGMGFAPGFRVRGIVGDFQRREVTVQTAEGTTSSRVEQGTLDSADDASLTFSLGNGETVTVALHDDSRLVGFESQERTRRGWSRTRLVPTVIAAADLQVGAEIVVWSDSEDGADFVASRVVVKPTVKADGAEADEAEATDQATDDPAPDTSEDTTDEPVVEDAATTDA